MAKTDIKRAQKKTACRSYFGLLGEPRLAGMARVLGRDFRPFLLAAGARASLHFGRPPMCEERREHHDHGDFRWFSVDFCSCFVCPEVRNVCPSAARDTRDARAAYLHVSVAVLQCNALITSTTYVVSEATVRRCTGIVCRLRAAKRRLQSAVCVCAQARRRMQLACLVTVAGLRYASEAGACFFSGRVQSCSIEYSTCDSMIPSCVGRLMTKSWSELVLTQCEHDVLQFR